MKRESVYIDRFPFLCLQCGKMASLKQKYWKKNFKESEYKAWFQDQIEKAKVDLQNKH